MEGETANARKRAIGGHAAVSLKGVCLRKDPRSPYTNQNGYVPFGNLVHYSCRSSWSAVLVATNFMFGRCTASAIVSASRKSFFCPLLYGRTYLAGISRALWPSSCSLRLR